MTRQNEEFESAFEAAQKKHPHIDRGVGKAFITKLQELLMLNRDRPVNEQVDFLELRNRALNHFKFEKKTRPAYSSLAGFYFGRRGGRKKRTVSNKMQSRPKARPTTTAVTTTGNQLAWDF